MNIVGIVNITTDSFSDGGQFLGTDAAIAQAQKLIADGADIIELSGASSNPSSALISSQEQISRMEPVLAVIEHSVSIDATEREVQMWALEKSVAYINDIKGFPDASVYPALANSSAKLVVMHAITDTDKADRAEKTTEEVFASLYSFFDTRLPALESAGIARERIIIDPGMGFFLSSRSEPSYAVLDAIPGIKKRYGLPLMISVSRKSFLRGGFPALSPEVAARTLQLELAAIEKGADYIRTHDAGQLRRSIS